MDVEILENKATYYSRVDTMKPCDKCWAKIQEPEHWDPPGLYGTATDSDTITDSDDDGSDSDDDNLILPNDDFTTNTGWTPGRSSTDAPRSSVDE